MPRRKIDRRPKPAGLILGLSLYRFIGWGKNDTAVVARIHVFTSRPWPNMALGKQIVINWPPDNHGRTFFIHFNNIQMQDLNKVTEYRDSLAEQTELLEKYGTIESIPADKKDDVYRLAVEGIKEVRAKRIDMEKQLRGTITLVEQWKKDLKTKAATVIDPLKALEAKLKDLRATADEAITNAQLEADAAKEKEYLAKTERLFSVGFAYNGVDYFSGSIKVTPEEIDAADEAQLVKWEDHGRNVQKAESLKPENSEVRPLDLGDGVQASHGTVQKVISDDSGAQHQQPVDNPIPDNPMDLFDDEQEAVEKLGVDDPANYRPEGYSVGFEACRKSIIEFLETGQKMRRADLIQWIKDLPA